MIKIGVLVFCPPSPGLCQRSEPADVAVSRALWGARPFQGAHDWAVWLPQVQLSLQEGEQVRQHNHVLALWWHICVRFTYEKLLWLILNYNWSPALLWWIFSQFKHTFVKILLRALTISPLNFQVLSLLQHRSPKPECDVRAGESGCRAHRLLGSKHIFGWWDRRPARY